ncbi:hypothetical protein COW36_21670 [bacterium (Candidatus Blackallbacteria) CG17_big_fil_post_rev_8_21_14_2_50_48_46]|uniref:Uncharacterized protein n=1 Tax=bacterium (Candidatus Blackallbacteria) CG17_big_fil_post_rev_8_21_14_2_50_48_46 TaxID=2014261 RepID=A0A2M7G0E3_9BACT|nr:MAG: hypothetical protein COW64_14970 [bacterium (Candidatus Blackallbacteria) CG18_big_fil_WC_8_21_14_2_50_49_26]PIW14649.1 MAG: hypothetical protein COW36_21670 [bacterium (Candidatus Blackallbacteria) CG17_big_fil_post_rev_8_21_14_2_50_48_46]PIW45700.1 MAG: hypothetical protein COW20_19500 [bacterium (Candidatus Blackallbacteria) CG13_big_fil_rev_8_21_14_2_50_49_14]
MEILIGIFILWLGYVWGKTQQKQSVRPYDSVREGQYLLLQEEATYLLEWQKLYEAGLISTQKHEQILAWYYSENSQGPQRLRSTLGTAARAWKQSFQQELLRLKHSRLLSESEYQACMAWFNPTQTTEQTSEQTKSSTPLPAPVETASVPSSALTVIVHETVLPHAKSPKVYNRPDVLLQLLKLSQKLTQQRWTNGLIALGVLSLILSSLPVIQHMSSASLIYAVMLAYSAGLLGAGLGVMRRFPWTGQMLTLVTLLSLPLDYASLVTLDPAQTIDAGITVLALGLLPLLSWLGLRALVGKPDLLYVLALIGIGWFSALLRGLAPLSLELTGGPRLFAQLCVFLPWPLVLLGLWRTTQNFWILPETRQHNLIPQLGLIGYLLLAALMPPVIYSVSWPLMGLALSFSALAIFWSADRLRALLALLLEAPWPHFFWRWVREQELVAGLVLAGGIALASGEALPLLLSAGLGGLWLLALSRHWQNSPLRWGIYLYSATLLALALLGLSQDWLADQRSLMLAACALALSLLAWVAPAEHWRRHALHQTGIFLSSAAWIQIALFRDWSLQTLAALALLAGVYLSYAAQAKRNLFSYIGIVTLSISALSCLAVWRPGLNFAAYRFYALALAWLMLGLGLLIQFSTPRRKESAAVSETEAPPEGLWARLNADRYHPFRFRQRFANLRPYLYSEPLYNLALLITSIVTLSDVEDLRLTALATLFYGAIFMIYPARLWIYFVIVSASDSLLELSGDLLPQRYQSWSLLMLGLGWFFVGKLVEELLEGRDRTRHDAAHEAQKRLAKPFFHGAIFINVVLLRYFFGDLQNLFSEEGWLNAAQEALPVMLTSFFYLLNLRVYVSKLWLYPGIISATLGLYFGLTQILPPEMPLLVFTALAGLWLELARRMKTHSGLNQWWQALIAYRHPEGPPSENYARIHLEDFSSPLWTLGLILAGCSLAFSSLLIPWQNLYLAQNFELALLTRSQPLTLYGMQFLNFLALALLFKELAQPLKKPLLWLEAMALSSLTLGAAWIFQADLSLDQLGLFFSAAALVWTLVWLRFESKQVLEWGSFALILLGFGALGLTHQALSALLSLGLLGLACLLRLKLRPSPWPLYIFTCFCLIAALVLKDGLHWISPLQAALLPLAGGGLLWALERSMPAQSAWKKDLWALNLLLLGVQHLTQAVILLQLWRGLSDEFPPAPPGWAWLAVGLALGQALWIWSLNRSHQSPLLQGWMLAQTLLASWLAMLNQPWLLWPLIGLPWLLAHRWPILPEAKWLNQAAAQLTPFLLAWGLFSFPEGLSLNLLYFWRLLPLLLWGLFYAREARSLPQQPWLWWLSLLSWNLAWIFTVLASPLQSFENLGISFEFSKTLLVHALLIPIALSLVWLSWKTLHTQPNRNQLFYIGLGLLLAPAGLSLMAVWGFPLLRGALLLELLGLVLGMIWLAFVLRQRAFLHVPLLLVCLGLLGGAGATLIWGHWGLRWGLFILLGLGFMVAGNLFQSHAESLRLRLEAVQDRLESWD